MAYNYFPRNYNIPQNGRYADYPTFQPDNPGYGRDNPGYGRDNPGYGRDYPDYQDYTAPRRPVYGADDPDYPSPRQGYTPQDAQPATKAIPPDTKAIQPDTKTPSPADKKPTDYVVNKRYKYYGITLILLSLASFGVEAANLIYTAINCHSTSNAGLPPYIFTWISPGVWGSIPVLITGALAYHVAGTYNKQVRIFGLFLATSAFFFTPAIIAISIVEIIFYNPTGSNCLSYNFSDVKSLASAKFILPVIVTILGGIEFYLTMMVTITLYCCKKKGPGNAANTASDNTPSSKNKSSPPSQPQQQQPADDNPPRRSYYAPDQPNYRPYGPPVSRGPGGMASPYDFQGAPSPYSFYNGSNPPMGNYMSRGPLLAY